MRRRTLLSMMGAGLALAGCGRLGESESFVPDPDALQVYSSQHENLTNAWVEAYTRETGVKIQVRKGSDSSMGHQIVAEGDASPADVFLTENSPAMTVVERAGLLAEVDATTRSQIPDDLRPSTDRWTAIAARSTVLCWNPAMIGEADLPVSMTDLAEQGWWGRWGCAPGGADFQAIVAGMLADRGEDTTRTWLQGLKDGARVMQNNIATMKAVNAGEMPLGIMYHYYWYRDQAGTREGSANTRLHYFRRRDPGAFVSLSAGGVLAGSERRSEAQDFLAFVTGPEGQKVLVESGAMEYAVGKGVDSAPELPPLESLEAPPVDPFTLDSDKVIQLMTDVGLL